MIKKITGITGAAGFIGSHLRETLEKKGFEAVVFEGDIVNLEDVGSFMERCNVIFHLAAKNMGPDTEITRINIEGAKNLSKHAQRIGGKHIIFSSSNLVYRRPECAYAKSKLAGEEMFEKIAGSNGCKVTIYRIANTYGPGTRPFYNSVMGTFCWYAAKGLCDQLPIHGDGTQEVEFIPVEEVVNHLIKSIDQYEDLRRDDIRGKVFSVIGLAEVICDPEKLKDYPTLKAEYDFFKNASLPEQKETRPYPVHSSSSGSFHELLHCDEVLFGQLSICTIAPNDERGGHYHHHKEEWFCVIQGRMALDFYTEDGKYVTTQLLEAKHLKFVHIPPPYYHIVRNIGSEEVKFLIVANEVFDSENPDTFRFTFPL